MLRIVSAEYMLHFLVNTFAAYMNIFTITSPFQVNILKRVLEEVEKVMHEFKGTLYKSMEDPKIDLTNVSC